MVKPEVKSLYRGYFQKSKIFMYPALGIKAGNSIIPVETYISCPDHGIKPRDRRLICLYHEREDGEYKEFERVKLKGNKLFDRMIKIDEELPKVAYVFDFSCYTDDWGHFLNGRYSKMGLELKRKTKDFFKTSEGNQYVYIESFLHPEKYYALYAELLNVTMDVLRDAGELCSPPDFDKETMKPQVNKVNNATLTTETNITQ